MNATIERRNTALPNALEVNTSKPRLEGLAARYNSLSQDLGGFRERIASGAFRKVLNQDVRCLQDHDSSRLLGRTVSRTLTLQESASGLRFAVDLPDTSVGRDVHALVKRGDISQCSFGFVVGQGNDDYSEEEDEEGNRFVCRTIRSFQTLTDVSVVTYPAYLDTDVSARSIVPDAVLAEARSFAQRAGFVAVPPHRRSRAIELVSPVEREQLLAQAERQKRAKAIEDWRTKGYC